MAAVPKPDPRRRDRPIKLPGEVASPANPPSGCYFHPRCRYAKDICVTSPRNWLKWNLCTTLLAILPRN